MKRLTEGLRIAGGTLLGYAAMVILITLVQEGLFGGVSYHGSPFAVLVVAGILTTLSAVAGGALAGWIASPVSLAPPAIMSVLVVVETTYLTLSRVLDGPLWFDIAAAGSLIVGLFAGAILVLLARDPHAIRSS